MYLVSGCARKDCRLIDYYFLDLRTAKVPKKGELLPQIVAPLRDNVTQTLLKMWKMNRKNYRIKTKRETPAQINRRMRMKFLPKIEAMTPYETVEIHKFHVDFDAIKVKARRRKKYEFKPLPSPEGEKY